MIKDTLISLKLTPEVKDVTEELLEDLECNYFDECEQEELEVVECVETVVVEVLREYFSHKEVEELNKLFGEEYHSVRKGF